MAYIKNIILGALLSATFCSSTIAQKHTPVPTYTKKDSTQVVTLLKKGQSQPKGTNLMIFYANQLKDIPYVASTLEVNPEEHLAINLTQLDCATLVDNAVALTLTTTRSKSNNFSDFCYWLQRIRYRNGQLDGYASRNHYFTQWVNSNEKMGIVQEITGNKENGYSPFTAQKTIDLHYMTAHPEQYPLLKKEKAQGVHTRSNSQSALIKQYEQEANGKVSRYIPHSLLNKGKDILGAVQDGDILALVTKKDGLDVSHLGLAVWGKDGKLHLLNASSIHHKVVLEPMTLYQYMTKHPSQLGIRVVRLKIED